MSRHIDLWNHTNTTTHRVIDKFGNILLCVNHLSRVGALLGQLTVGQHGPFLATLESVVAVLYDFKLIVRSCIVVVLAHGFVIQEKWEGGRVGDVPMERVQFIHRHGVDGTVQCLHGEIVPARIEKHASEREQGSVVDDNGGLTHFPEPILSILGH